MGSPEPSFAIVARPRTPIVDPEDDVRIEVYIAGAGDVTSHMLYFNAPEWILEDGLEIESFQFLEHRSGDTPAVPILPPQRHKQRAQCMAVFADCFLQKNRDGHLHSQSAIN